MKLRRSKPKPGPLERTLGRPDALAPNRMPIRKVGSPFSIQPGLQNPVVWQACLYADGVIRPVRADALEPLPPLPGAGTPAALVEPDEATRG